MSTTKHTATFADGFIAKRNSATRIYTHAIRFGHEVSWSSSIQLAQKTADAFASRYAKWIREDLAYAKKHNTEPRHRGDLKPEIVEAKIEEPKTTKAIAYAYPSSHNATKFGFKAEGCYTIELITAGKLPKGIDSIKAVKAFLTWDEAHAYAETLPQTYNRYSIPKEGFDPGKIKY